MFTSDVDFVMGQCPKGFCVTRSPPIKNPCVGRANAIRIDGFSIHVNINGAY